MESNNYDLKVYERAILDRKYIWNMLDRVNALDGSIILDLGCGYGGSSEIIYEYNNRYQVIGIDKDTHKIEYARQNSGENINYQIADATKLPYPDNTFDVTFERMLFEVCNDIEKIISEMYRVTKHNGILAFYGNISSTPLIFPEPVYYSKYRISEERLAQITKHTIYNPLELVNRLFEFKISDMIFEPFFKNSISDKREDLFKYYCNDIKTENNLLVTAGLMSERELRSFYSDFNKLLLKKDSIVLFSQYYLIAKKI